MITETPISRRERGFALGTKKITPMTGLDNSESTLDT